MPYPDGLLTRDVSFGQAFALSGGDRLAMQVSISASRDLVHRPSGSPLVAKKTFFLSDDVSGNQIITLPVTDSDDMGTGDNVPIVLEPGQSTHFYSASIKYLDPETKKPLPGVAVRTIGVFTLPTGSGGTVDLDDLYAPLTPNVPLTLSLLEQFGVIRDDTVAARVEALLARDDAQTALAALVNSGGGWLTPDPDNPGFFLYGEPSAVVLDTDPGIPTQSSIPDYLEVVVDDSGRLSEGTEADGTKFLPRARVDRLTQGDAVETVAVVPGYRVLTRDESGKMAEPDAMTTDGRTPHFVLRNHRDRSAKALLGVRAIGDSMTDGIGTGVTVSFPDVMDADVPVAVVNQGLYSLTSTEVAILAGGLDVFVTASGNTIPTSGTVAVTITPTVGFVGVYEHQYAGTLAGVPGVLIQSTAGTWTFRRDTSGTAVTIAPETPWVAERQFEPMVGVTYWAGRNNVNTTVNIRDALAVVTKARRVGAPVLVISVFNTSDEPSGSAGYNNVATVNGQYASAFGSDYYDLRGWLIRNATYILTTAGVTPTGADNTAIAADIVPPSLRADNGADTTHLNNIGNTAVGHRIAELTTAKGWYS